MNECWFTIHPDEGEHTTPGAPVAAFADLEDAVEWALARYGSDRFRIRALGASPPEPRTFHA